MKPSAACGVSPTPNELRIPFSPVMTCNSAFSLSLTSVWISLALSLALASSGLCNSLTNKLLGVGGEGRNRSMKRPYSSQKCHILQASQALARYCFSVGFHPFLYTVLYKFHGRVFGLHLEIIS